MMNKISYDNTFDIPIFSVGIVLGGEIIDYAGFERELSKCMIVVCADGGARHLTRIGFNPDILVGDFDSISEEDLKKLMADGVPCKRFPPEKNFTDSELAIEAALDLLNEKTSDQYTALANSKVRFCLFAATGDRPDHMLANQFMAARMSRSGYDVMVSDGLSKFYLLEGPADRTFNTDDSADQAFAVSAVAMSNLVEGITYTGLKYPLENYDLAFGSQRGVSNCINKVPDCSTTEDSINEFTVSIKSGTLMLIITPAK